MFFLKISCLSEEVRRRSANNTCSYHAGDASCQAAVVADLAVGELCCPQLPLGQQQHGPDRTWVWDAGNEVTGPSSPPGYRDDTQGKRSELQKLRDPFFSTEKHSQKRWRIGHQCWRALISDWGRETTQCYYDYTNQMSNFICLKRWSSMNI